MQVTTAQQTLARLRRQLRRGEEGGVLGRQQELASCEGKLGVLSVPHDGQEPADAALRQAAGALADAVVGGPVGVGGACLGLGLHGRRDRLQ